LQRVYEGRRDRATLREKSVPLESKEIFVEYVCAWRDETKRSGEYLKLREQRLRTGENINTGEIKCDMARKI
jgi:hypothetical protein